MINSTLEYARENYLEHLRKALTELSSARVSPSSFFMATFSYRILGICSLLLDGDRPTFAAMLCKAGQVRLEFLKHVSSGLEVSPKYICTSKNIGFTAALAAGDHQCAIKIAEFSPKIYFSDVEYEDDFLFFHFLHRIVCEPSNKTELIQIIKQWEEVLEGQSSGYLDVCQALFSEQPSDFEEGFVSLLVTRVAQISKYKERLAHDEELFATECRIFIEGLAVLKIAEMKGLPTEAEYELLPEISRVPSGLFLPLGNSWKSLDITD